MFLKTIDSIILFLEKNAGITRKKNPRPNIEAKRDRLMKDLAKAGVVVVDDQGLLSLLEDSSRDLTETLAEGGRKGSTFITGKLPLDNSYLSGR
jgi:hypothetical protein